MRIRVEVKKPKPIKSISESILAKCARCQPIAQSGPCARLEPAEIGPDGATCYHPLCSGCATEFDRMRAGDKVFQIEIAKARAAALARYLGE
jgi:hypothetical protein